MKDSTLECPPFTRRQLDLLEKLKAEIEKRDALPALGPEVPKINKRIDELSVKALASGLMKGRPAESRRPGKFLLEFNSTGEYAEIKPGFGDFHPDLPSWAKDHFIRWIREHRAGIWGPDDRKILRKTKIVGIETGMKRPVDMTFLIRVLELRGYEAKDDPDKEDGRISKKKKKRTRKEDQPWWRVIEKLVEEGLVKKVKTPSGEKNPSVQAFKKMLKNRYSFHPWDET
ncbi:MAG: hypothetical protein M0P73_01310 [Syntrophobacterales bacterium]|jgi:hypothetical protein|nr:hypothetical protein [Syntrophobacterales bacterium]